MSFEVIGMTPALGGRVRGGHRSWMTRVVVEEACVVLACLASQPDGWEWSVDTLDGDFSFQARELASLANSYASRNRLVGEHEWWRVSYAFAESLLRSGWLP